MSTLYIVCIYIVIIVPYVILKPLIFGSTIVQIYIIVVLLLYLLVKVRKCTSVIPYCHNIFTYKQGTKNKINDEMECCSIESSEGKVDLGKLYL